MRTFIAIDLDDAVRRDLGRLIDRLRPKCGAIQWSSPEKIHLTLKFLGEIGDDAVVPICGALRMLAEQCRPFEVSIHGTGVFPAQGAARVVWAGVQDQSGDLARCRDLCEDLVAPLGFPTEHRPFTPHLTLARNRTPKLSTDIRLALQSEAEFSAGLQPVDRVTLYQSTMTPNGSIYRPLCKYEFSG